MFNPEKKKLKNKIKKPIKSVFGRLTMIGAAILLQLALLLFVSLELNTAIIPLQTASYILAFIAALHLESRDMISEMKVPWMFLILLFPLFGSFVYFLLSENRTSVKRKKLLGKICLKSRLFSYPESDLPFSTDEVEATETIEEFGEKRLLKKANKIMSGDESGQSRFLTLSAGLMPYGKCITEYYPDGESFWESMCLEMEQAEKFIFLEYFIIGDGVMLERILDILERKAKEGVEVRLLYDDLGSIGKVPCFYPDYLKTRGINCKKFNSFVPFLTAVQNNRDHRKITVIDGKTGFIGGTNIADEYINVVERFGNWKDSSVMIKGNAVKSLTLMFLQLWALQNGKCDDFSYYIDVDAGEFEGEEGFVQPYGSGPRPIYGEAIAENLYVNMIEQAKKSLFIMTPYFVTGRRVTDALKSAKKRGVDVRIVIPSIPDKKAVYLQTKRTCAALKKCGIRIYEYTPGFVHSKNVLVDGKSAVCGTINFDFRSFYHHYECAVLLVGTKSVKAMNDDFEDTFLKSREWTEEDSLLSLPQKAVATLGILLTPLL